MWRVGLIRLFHLFIFFYTVHKDKSTAEGERAWQNISQKM